MASENKEIRVSVVIPVWNEEEENIREIHLRLTKVLAVSEPVYEIIFVDDGSRDETFECLTSLLSDKHLKIVKLSKHFGQIPAVLAGLQYAKGQIIVTMDMDMQCLPEDIPKLLDEMNKGHDMVSGRRKNRQDPLLSRIIPSYIINKFIVWKTGMRFDWGCSLNAATSNLTAKLKDYGETARFLKPLVAHLANSPIEVEVQQAPRKIGRSKYSFFHLAKIARDILINFTLSPGTADQPLFIVQEVVEPSESEHPCQN